MNHLGDITKINGAEIEPVDIITFGSPCQDLSLAGKRAGLKHEAMGDEETTRSGLFMEAVRIIKEMRESTNGKYPTFALWENVPGAFSSNKGEDFRTVLEELIKVVEPSAVVPAVPPFGWAYADSYVGDGWSLAYRTFDAQYWGVPQRRRRIYLVLDLRGQRARQVLFEREGLRWHPAESRAAREEYSVESQGSSGTEGAECSAYIVESMGGHFLRFKESKVSHTLTTKCNEAILAPSCGRLRLFTPTECARLQGFADCWGDIEKKEDLTDEEFRFWLDVRNTHAAVNGKKVRNYTKEQMLTWYNKLHNDGAEYKMWGNGVALPTALYCMQGMAEALINH